MAIFGRLARFIFRFSRDSLQEKVLGRASRPPFSCAEHTLNLTETFI
jgi:hypothetical protein